MATLLALEERQEAVSDCRDLHTEISHELEDPQWDSFLCSQPRASYPQSSWWARGKGLLGYRAVRIKVAHGDRIVGGAQVLIRPFRFAGNFGFVPLGPVLGQDRVGLAELVLNHLRIVARDEHLRYLAVQPPLGGEAMDPLLHALKFQAAPLDLAPSASVCLDLSNDLKTLLRRMHRHTRRNIQTSENCGVVVREGNESDLALSHKLMIQTGNRHGYSPYRLEYFTQLWKIFAPAGLIKLFIAEVEGEAVSALFAIVFGDTATAWKFGWSGLQHKRFPNEAIHWAAIQWAASNGCRYYDGGGINREIAIQLSGAASSGIQTERREQFKTGFGGEVVVGPRAYGYLPNPVLRLAHRAIPNDIAQSHRLVPALNWVLSKLR